MFSISDLFKLIKNTSGLFCIISIEVLQNIQTSLRKIFDKSLSIDAIASFSRREEDGDYTLQEQRGFNQILDDYSKANILLNKIKIRNFILKILKPFVITILCLIVFILSIVLTNNIDRISILLPILKTNNVLSTIFTTLLTLLFVTIIASIFIRTSGDLFLEKLYLIMMEYDISGTLDFSKINPTLNQKEAKDIDESIKSL